MQGLSIGKSTITIHNLPGIVLGFHLIGGHYHINQITTGTVNNHDTDDVPRKLVVILHPSTTGHPFLELRHIAHPLPVVVRNKRLCQRGFNLRLYLVQMENEAFFAGEASATRNTATTTIEYRETWRSLYSIVHQNGSKTAQGLVQMPKRVSAIRTRLLTVISAYKQMAVPIKPLNTIDEKLAFLDTLEALFVDDYEYYACLRTYIIDQVGYRLFLETCDLSKFVLPLHVRNRVNFANRLDSLTTSIRYLRDHPYIERKIGDSLKQCFRIHQFN